MKDFKLGGQLVPPGTSKEISLKVASLYDYTEMSIPLKVIHGENPGPRLFISSAIHGDEINGVEIVRRLLKRKELKNLNGILIAVPIVNIFGFNTRSRYMPDRRDLNRCFPGSETGSLGARVAHIFMREVVSKCTHGIDLHTGAIHRSNLPQIRAKLKDDETQKLARAFGCPVIINAEERDGSLREAAGKKKIPILVYEGGEALRFNERAIRAGLEGCLSVMQSIGMITRSSKDSNQSQSFVANGSYWLRAPRSGTFLNKKKLGDTIEVGDILAYISDPLGKMRQPLIADEAGVIIGQSNIPLVNRGDAMFHIASFNRPKKVKKALNQLEDGLFLSI